MRTVVPVPVVLTVKTTGMVSSVVPLLPVTFTLPLYVPAARFTGLAVMVRVAGLVLAL